MIGIPFDILLIINAALLLFAFIVASLLLRMGVLYVRNIGDSDRQSTQKKIILTMIFMLFFTSLAAAIFNVLIIPI